MAVDSGGATAPCMASQWEDRETSPERNKLWSEPKPKATEQKVPVVYYLSRNGQLEHPHFMEVPLSSSKGLYLRDVLNRLNSLRGQGMAELYSWSSKRGYRNGFVWQDLSKNDLIYPCHRHEYVLKGSQLLETSLSFRSYETVSSSTSNISSETKSSSIDSDAQVLPRKKNPSWSSFEELREYQFYKAKTGGEFAGKGTNAATQTEDKGRQRRKDREEVQECEGTAVTKPSGEEVSLAFSKSGFGGLGSLETSSKVEGSAATRNQTLESDRPSGRLKPATVLMQLIRCGSQRIKDCDLTGSKD